MYSVTCHDWLPPAVYLTDFSSLLIKSDFLKVIFGWQLFKSPLTCIKDLSVYSKRLHGLDLAEKGFALRLRAVRKILLGECARTLRLPTVSIALNMARMNTEAGGSSMY